MCWKAAMRSVVPANGLAWANTDGALRPTAAAADPASATFRRSRRKRLADAAVSAAFLVSRVMELLQNRYLAGHCRHESSLKASAPKGRGICCGPHSRRGGIPQA